MPNYTYPEDRTGVLPGNRIVSEQHVVTFDNARGYHFLIPVFAPFFADSLRMYKQVGGALLPLTSGSDFHFGLHFVGASLSTAQDIYGAIVPLNVSEDTIFVIEYQTLGGQWVLDLPAMTTVAADIAKNPRALAWEQLVNLPTMFSPTDHPWNFEDMVGQTALVNAIVQVATAILNKSSDDTANHTKNLLNPHNTTKEQLNLGKVQNFGPAGAIDAIDGLSDDTVITPAMLRLVLDNLGVLSVANNLKSLENHISDPEIHNVTKKKLALENVSNYPVVSRDDVMRNARVQKYVTMDMLIEWFTMWGGSNNSATKAPIPQGALLHQYCNSNYDRMGTYSDGKGGTYESVLVMKDPDCGYQSTVPIAHPVIGTLLSQYCSGAVLMGLKADGAGGVFSEVLKANATECTNGTAYPPVGSVLGTVCEGTTLVRTIANGTGGNTFDRVANSPECNNVAHPPAGTLASYACRGFDMMGTYTDGSGGTYEAIMTRNSTECGYVAVTTPPSQTFQPAGTVVGYVCTGFNRQEIRANGSGGTYNITVTVNAAECGYTATTAPTQPPLGSRSIQFSSTHSSIWEGDIETFSAVFTGWTPNATFNFKLFAQTPSYGNGLPVETLARSVTTDSAGNATFRYVNTNVGLTAGAVVDCWITEVSTGLISNHITRRFMGTRANSTPSVVYTSNRTTVSAGMSTIFTAALSGMQPNTTYTVKAWAISSVGVVILRNTIVMTTDALGNATSSNTEVDDGDVTIRGTWSIWGTIVETNTVGASMQVTII